jgi:hypothetical protein
MDFAQPLYAARTDDGAVVLFEGPVLVKDRLEPRMPVRIELSVDPPRVYARFRGEPSFSTASAFFDTDDPSIEIPADADLAPPTTTQEKFRPPDTSWIDSTVTLSQIIAGDLGATDRLVIHVSGALETLPVRAKSGRVYAAQPFELCGWKVQLRPTGNQVDGDPFVAVIEAEPPTRPPDQDAVDFLHQHLFLLLGLLTNREIGIGPICGLSGDRVVWVEWGASRLRSGRPGIRWCPGHLAQAALPTLSSRLTEIARDKALDLIVERAINFLLAADGTEVLDVRVPMAWSGVELLAWAVLQRERLRAPSEVRRIRADDRVERLLKWAAIPVHIPDGLATLGARARRLDRPQWTGPKVVYDVRNAVVHPPDDVEDPEWPQIDELFEAWQLATWYLELVILRLLRYEGEYWSRLRLGRSAMDTELVPWAAVDGAD